MRLMLRTAKILTLSLLLGAALWPMGLMASNVGHTLEPDKCVQIAIPLISGGATCVDNTGPGGAIVLYMRDALKLLAGGVGTVIMLVLVWAGIGYITSAGQPENLKAAKKKIENALTALVLFLLTVAIMNFLVPGGLL